MQVDISCVHQFGGGNLSMKFIIQAGKERLESNGGLVLGGKILSGLNLDRRVNGIVIDGALEPKIQTS